MTPGIDPVARIRAITLGAAVPGVRLVGIDGPSASGKSTLAKAVAADLKAPIVEIDDFLSWTSLDDWWPRFDAQVVQPLLRGADIRYQVRDWQGDEFGSGLAGWKSLSWHPIVIFEGISSTRSAVTEFLACRVWVEAGDAQRLERGVARDGESHRRLWERFMAVEREFFEVDATRARADVIVDTSHR